MSWVVRIAEDVHPFVNGLPQKDRRQIARCISQLEQDPFQGDVKPLKGDIWRGHYRKRVSSVAPFRKNVSLTPRD